MSQTPEGKVKDQIRAILKEFDAYYFMPVQTGYGQVALDFHPCIVGKTTFFIEAKSEHGTLTARQANLIDELRRRGLSVFVVKTKEDLLNLRLYIAGICV